MIYQDSVGFADEDVVQLYGYGSVEDIMALESMSGHGKKPQYEFFGISEFPVLLKSDCSKLIFHQMPIPTLESITSYLSMIPQ